MIRRFFLLTAIICLAGQIPTAPHGKTALLCILIGILSTALLAKS